jgi:hypothetical protein
MMPGITRPVMTQGETGDSQRSSQSRVTGVRMIPQIAATTNATRPQSTTTTNAIALV